MGDDPGKCERKVGILETLCKSGPRGRLRSCRLPQAPGFGRALPEHGIRTVQQSVVNVDDIARAIGGWYGGQEPVPLFGKNSANPPRKAQSNSLRRPVVTPNRIMSVTRRGWLSA